MTSSSAAVVIPIIEGFCVTDVSNDVCQAVGSVTLVVGGNIRLLVDTAGPNERHQLIEGLKLLAGTEPEQVSHVVCTHGHLDHIGNLNLFPNALIILDRDMLLTQHRYATQVFGEEDDNNNKRMPISNEIAVVFTPGHTSHDLSVFVSNSTCGNVAIAGDIFECEDDHQIWTQNSYNTELQEKSRNRILEFADWIVPGHGKMFKVNKL